MEQNQDILKIDHLSHSFGKKEVLHDLSFTVHNGEFLSIIGSSGCGKTTLLRILIGLIKPSNGKIYKNDKDITELSPSKRGMGIVFQNYALFENMTVLKNVEYAMRINPEKREHSKETAIRLLDMVGLSEYGNKHPHSLSGGQQQRVAIARTLALEPDIILFDEPMSALDVDTRLKLRSELKDLQKKLSATMIYITHDQEEAFAMSDRIMVIHNGIAEQLGLPDEIIDHPATDYVQKFVGDNINIKIRSLERFARDKK